MGCELLRSGSAGLEVGGQGDGARQEVLQALAVASAAGGHLVIAFVVSAATPFGSADHAVGVDDYVAVRAYCCQFKLCSCTLYCHWQGFRAAHTNHHTRGMS